MIGVTGTAIGFWFFLVVPTLMAFGNQMWSGLNDFIPTPIPLFALLGELLVRLGVAEGLYRCLSDWLRRLSHH